jgi:GNAT superfamily N-acetyltransferase
MIRYIHTAENILPEHLEGFFEGWVNPPSCETHLDLLRRSDEIIIAFDESTGKVVGFITAITDHILSAYIPLVEVLPEYRRKGIGTELTRRMLKCLEGVYMIDLLCDEELQPFYAELGMSPARGMMIRNFRHQSGGGLAANEHAD